jgi:hypothetical protein
MGPPVKPLSGRDVLRVVKSAREATERKREKFAAKVNKKEYKEKEAIAQPILGIFGIINVDQVPFEIERRCQREKFELEAELTAKRRDVLRALEEKLGLGAELFVQQEREDLIEKSKLIAHNSKVLNTIRRVIIKTAKKRFSILDEEANSAIFDDYTSTDGSIPISKQQQIEELIDQFFVNHKRDIDNSLNADLVEERELRINDAAREAAKISSEWSAVVREDVKQLHDTMRRDAEIELGLTDISDAQQVDTCSHLAPLLLSTGSFVNKQSSDYAEFNLKLFHAGAFSVKAQR